MSQFTRPYLGRAQEARNATLNAYELTKSIDYYERRSMQSVVVARALARSGLFRKARLVCDNSQAEHRLDAYTAMLEEWAAKQVH